MILARLAAAAVLAVAAAACGATASDPVPRTPAEAKRTLLAVPLVDVRTGEHFTLGDFRGKVVVAMPIAVW